MWINAINKGMCLFLSLSSQPRVSMIMYHGRVTNMKLVLSQESIHHAKNPAACPYCHQYDMHFAGKDQDQDTEEEARQRKQLDDHRELAHDQRAAFVHDLQCLQQGTNNRHIIIVHDFSQVNTTKHNFQDYILVTHERAQGGGTQQTAFHFIAANHMEDHNEEFVEQAWRSLLDPNTGKLLPFLSFSSNSSLVGALRDYATLDLWSDGGPHHFKNKNTIYMWHWLM